METQNKHWLIASSVDPSKVAMTVKGILVGILPILVMIAPYFGIPIDDLNGVIDAIVKVVEVGLTLVASVMVLFGLLRKAYLKVKVK